jgi:EmrB/QacA subfamily drug resistance transporter
MTPANVERTSPATDPLEAGRTHSTAVLAIICVSYFMVILDNSIIFTALPSIRAGMDLTDTGLAWVQDAYALLFGGLMLLGARSGDLLGRRRMFLVSLVVFAVASFLVGAAPTGWWLIAARALQGVGAAILAPTSLALLTASFPEGPQRSRAVATYAAVAGIGASAGLVVGGAVTDWVSWRAGFFLNVPIAAAMIWAGLRYLAETPRRPGRFDLIGALAATLGMGALVLGIIESAEVGWADPRTVVALLIGLVLLAALVLNEARAEQPIMPLRLFASRARSGAYAIRLLYLGAMIGFFYFTTQFLQDVLGWSALQAGFGFLPMTVVNFIVALRVPSMTRRLGSPTVLTAGIVLTLAGMAWLSRLTPETEYTLGMALPMVLIGAGQGLAFAPLTSYALVGVEAHDAGAASGVLNTAHQLGMALGLSVLVSIAARVPGTGASARADQVAAALTGSSMLLAAALVVLVALLLIRPANRTSVPGRTDAAAVAPSARPKGTP